MGDNRADGIVDDEVVREASIDENNKNTSTLLHNIKGK